MPGLLAHTIYLAVQRPPLGWQYGLLLALAWILAIFYLYGSVHHARQAWGIFVLLLYLRFGLHLRGRRLALLTVVAFGLLLLTLALPHMGRGGTLP